MKRTPLETTRMLSGTDETGVYRKKSRTASKSDSKKRADHKHKYEPVIIADRPFPALYWGKRCSICGRMQERNRFSPDLDFVKTEARGKNRQRITGEEIMSIPEIRAKYPGVDIVGVEEARPAEEKKGKNHD